MAAGSGITPILSIIKTTLEAEPNSQFTLLYGNRSSNSTLFREALSDLKNAYLGRFNVIYLFSREQQDVDLYNGRIDADKCDAIFSRWLDTPNLHAAFLCGPQSMTETVKERLVANGLDKSRVHFELFGVEGQTQRKHRAPEEVTDDEDKTQVTIIADGREVLVELPGTARTSSTPPTNTAPTCRSPARPASVPPAAARWWKAKWKWTTTSPWKTTKSPPATCSPARATRSPTRWSWISISRRPRSKQSRLKPLLQLKPKPL
ncbi:1,2-phenylacetyl-CoA epoxidase, subunit E [Alcanivorax sp. ALC70]|nr:1,2-phenylacetyl-CoA epoxidase, subunit E [Alcanivorax sp. ALC70]